MNEVSFERLSQSERITEPNPKHSYLVSYREFLTYFASIDTITPHHLIIGAHFVYGWMPTILELYITPESLPLIVKILNEVKHSTLIGTPELIQLKSAINNSLPGTSKLLHFINPYQYPIWDSRVHRYINGKDAYNYQISKPENYLEYQRNCHRLAANPGFPAIHRSMNTKIGYEVTPLRAIEMIMYLNG